MNYSISEILLYGVTQVSTDQLEGNVHDSWQSSQNTCTSDTVIQDLFQISGDISDQEDSRPYVSQSIQPNCQDNRILDNLPIGDERIHLYVGFGFVPVDLFEFDVGYRSVVSWVVSVEDYPEDKQNEANSPMSIVDRGPSETRFTKLEFKVITLTALQI